MAMSAKITFSYFDKFTIINWFFYLIFILHIILRFDFSRILDPYNEPPRRKAAGYQVVIPESPTGLSGI
jgi:hypothetical protein